MKWYPRDPDAALNGMRGLTHDEKSAYNTILDLLYSRDGHLPDNERLLCIHIGCRPQWWRRVRASLMARGKIWVTVDGNLMAIRVELTLKDAGNFRETQSKRARIGWVSRRKVNDINGWPMPSGNANTKKERIKASFSVTAREESCTPEEKKADIRGSKQVSEELKTMVKAKDWDTAPEPKPNGPATHGFRRPWQP